MKRQVFIASRLREEWDGTSRTYTAWDANGTQVEQRPFTAPENAAADNEVAATAEETNASTLRQRADAALATNRADITQAQAIQNQALPIEEFVGAFNNSQRDAHIKSLAQGARLLAQQSQAQARELNEIIRLILERFDGTD